MSRQQPCQHPLLSFDVSPHGNSSGFQRASSQKRLLAATTKAKLDRKQDYPSTTYPAPLVLSGDDLDLDPKYPPQSLRSWLRSKDRNEVISDHSVLYLARPPKITKQMAFMNDWARPKSAIPDDLERPDTREIASYLEAFYHGMRTLILPSDLSFTTWDTAEATASNPKQRKPSNHSFLGLQTDAESIRIRTRASPDGIYSHQLNLNDLLDAAIAILPDDAYALLVLVEQDLYEDEDDLFVCGRAYGGSRVAVVSMARYHPYLDAQVKTDREHSWPASHCDRYINEHCNLHLSNAPSPDGAALILDDETPSPMEAAILAHRALPSPSSAQEYQGLWLSRICRTASHEVGHCFGVDHCVYYSCIMQGSANLTEDHRQPPFVCPVDLAKILRATGADEAQRNRNMLDFCSRHHRIHLFASLGAWLEKLLEL